MKHEIKDNSSSKWAVITETIGEESVIQIFSNKAELIACVYSKPDARAICTAVNETYGKGFDPSKMVELYKALERIASVDNSGQKLDGHDAEGFIRIAKTALHNAKTIKP